MSDLRAACVRNLSEYAPQRRTPEAEVRRWASEGVAGDLYGAGGVVTAVEQRVADLLGKPAAVFMPTGTMAQQIALRVHADRRDSRVAVFHPLCHLERHEERAFEHLHGLVGRPVGDEDRLLTVADLGQVSEPIAALLLELPQRMIGAQLPSWAELRAQVDWARERWAAVHLDGARLWEAQPFYGRPHAEIAALFDTVYVSFYKGLAGLGGCVLAGPAADVDEARVWRTRHGGVVFALWPYAAAALHGLDVVLPQMPARWATAQALAAELSALPGFGVRPEPPQTPIFQLLVDRGAADLVKARDELARAESVWLFDRIWDGTPARIEVTVSDQLAAFAAGEVGRLFARLRNLAT